MVHSRWGLFFRAIREDEQAAAACGVRVARFRILAFAVASGFAGLAGGFYAHYIGVLTPSLGSLDLMAIVVVMTVIGGMEALPTAVGGALAVEALLEYLRFTQWRWVLFGLLLLVTMRFARNGLLTPVWQHFIRLGDVRATPPTRRAGRVPRMTPEGMIVRGETLHKRFGGITAVDAVDFSVAEGDLIGLIGPNGSGKTTLINLLTGHLLPDTGGVFLRGRRVNGLAAHGFAALGVARTFQLSQLFGRMTVLENMLVPGLTRPGSTRAGVARSARTYLEFLNLAHLQDLSARNLSGGQQKLLELGRALMLEPTILFLDEPFAGVHPHLRDELIQRIQDLHRSGRTFVVVDHDMESIQRVARRLVVLARGQKIADGLPAAVRSDQTVLAAYSGL
jgi:ABC-type branched-subunit amino acid transport system ATPase component